MMNPFFSKKAWQEEKAKYGIPDKILKSGGFGDKVEGYRKKFEPLRDANAGQVPTVLKMLDEGGKVYAAWISEAEKTKPEAFKGGTKAKAGADSKSKAIAFVKGYAENVKGVRQMATNISDPFATSRRNYDKCANYLKVALKNPGDPSALTDLYKQGVRNDLGAPLHQAFKKQIKPSPQVWKLIEAYEQGAGAWDSKFNASAIAADPDKQKVFLDDMTRIMRIGVEILRLTK